MKVKDSLLAMFGRLPKRTLVLALAMDAAMLVLYLVGLAYVRHVPNLFVMMDLDSEANPQTWWYGIQQLLVAMTFLLLASRVFVSDARVRPLRSLFRLAGFVFVFISIDEVGELHERGSRLLQKSPLVRGAEERLMSALGISHHLNGGGTWIVVYAIIVIALAVWAVPQLVKAFRLWRRPMLTVVAGFVTFGLSAAVLQVVGFFFHVGTTAHNIYVFVEQALKMTGISIMLYGVVLVFAECVSALIRTVSAAEAAEPEAQA